ncbi:MAG: exosome complex RNA-binding protein Csl4 [Nitrosopumilus sp.]|nr:exosome complex RNA-binding protein Csl4 [Nitrosopumilus sp.]CAI9832621.1 Exosome complex component Csl4 [Nitrosopumilaceae archaeon]MDA7944936.1 exosome complex RNA-binding protein Csl4 [Nitrosopumilus sp.]MDA7953378.1 exosome complex RNA-binding protein Csl4 [Nitrosopumilus sp.]MDA7954690.1 exosome complex RNA-binding protein Csl4 [Nitrosopumilus sp.]
MEAIFPGDGIASIEEYEAGHNAFDDGDMVRAATVGTKEIDSDERTAGIRHPRVFSVPRKGDVVVGTVAAVMASMMAVRVDYVNGNPTTSKVECICSIRNIRIRNPALANDIVSLRVLGTLNGTVHGTIEERGMGVMFTKCRKCGGRVAPMRDAIKCADCGWIDERKLSADFGKGGFVRRDG